MNRRTTIVIRIACLTCVLAGVSAQCAARDDRPNVILVMTEKGSTHSMVRYL